LFLAFKLPTYGTFVRVVSIKYKYFILFFYTFNVQDCVLFIYASLFRFFDMYLYVYVNIQSMQLAIYIYIISKYLYPLEDSNTGGIDFRA